MTWAGRSASCTPSSVASGRREMRARGEHDGQVGRHAPSAPAPRRDAARGRPRSAPIRGVGRSVGQRRAPMRYAHCEPRRDTPRVHVRAPAVIALFGPTGVGKTAVAIALAERLRAARRGPGRRLRRRAPGLRAASRPSPGAPTAAERARLEHRLVVVRARRRPFSGGRVRRARPRRDRRPARGRPAADRRRRHRPLPARRARRPRPAPAARRRARASAGRPSSPSAARPRCTPMLAQRAPVGRGGDRPARPPAASCARSSCSTRGALDPPRGRRPAVDARHAPPDACSSGLVDGARGALRRASTRASTRWSPPAPRDEVRRAARRRRVGDRAQGAGFDELLDRRRRGDEAPHAQPSPSASSPGCASWRASHVIDVTGRADDDVAAEVERLAATLPRP